MLHNRSILITGIGSPAGRSAVTYFKAKSFSITGTDMRDVRRAVDTFYITPQADDLNYVSTLMDIIRRERPSLLIPTIIEELPVISSIKKEIEWEGCSVLISSQTAIDITNDRLKTAVIMAGHGIAVPAYCDEVTPADVIAERLGFPLLSKPRFRRNGRDVVIYKRYEDLYDTTREGLVFQELIPGAVFNLNLFVEKGGGIMSAVVLEKTSLNSDLSGNVLSVERVDRPEIVRIGARAAGILNLEGPVSMDIGLRSNYLPVLLDINARLGSNALLAWETLDCLLDAWKRLLMTGSYR
ncbi:MAG: ATP-grasp domain-containing protein [Nitrospirae bacterium]|nr:ATP-grasp domain-containing protein [Nitrospirota bacterium]